MEYKYLDHYDAEARKQAGRIPKGSSTFRGAARCHVLREHDDLNLNTAKNSNFDNAIIVKEIMKGYFNGIYQTSDFSDLVSQGVEDDFLADKQGELRKERLVKCLTRACTCEKRHPVIPDTKYFAIGPYDVRVKPDALFGDPASYEAVLYRAGKPNITQKGRKRDASANNSIELYFLLLYLRTFVKPGEKKELKASYYFLRKDTDNNAWDPDFFSGHGNNIVTISEVYEGGQTAPTDYDKSFSKQIDEFIQGTSNCTEDDCKNCSLKPLCQYQKVPPVYEAKLLTAKKGTITPSETQQAIIDFRKGVCRVNATAGSGKTECMTERGARMLEEGVQPEEILFITFTDAGALEMKERIIKKCEARNLFIDTDRIQAMTFNTFAYRIVKANYEDCGFTKPPIVIDDVRNAVIVTQMLNEKPVAGLDYLNFTSNMPNCKGALVCAISVFNIIKTLDIANDPNKESIVNRELREHGIYRFYNITSVDELISMYNEYDKRLKEDCLLQFADQEILMNKVLDMHPGYLDQYGYKHIIVDEFQDSNDVQLDTIKRLTQCPTFESLMVVGDDSQSIYGFRNTSPENILHFFEKIGLNGTDLYLTENRRSTPEILELANKINDLNEEKVDKAMIAVRDHGYKPVVAGFFSKEDEYKYIADEINRLIKAGTIPEDIAFIAAKKSELVAMSAELAKRGIPWVMKNPMPLMENSRVQAAISLAEAFWQPDADDSYFNYLVAKYDGEIFNIRTQEQISDEIRLMRNQFMHMDGYNIKYQRILFHRMLDAIKGTDEIYAYFLELLYQNEDFQTELQYIHDFKTFGESAAKKMEQSYAGVVLTTAHSSKGLEWPVVFNSISGYDSKRLHPSGKVSDKIKKEIEEKRRLLFVSMTRARDLLYVTGQFVAYGAKDDKTYNQFVREIYEAAGMAYNPVDPFEGMSRAEKEAAKKLLEETKETDPEKLKELLKNVG